MSFFIRVPLAALLGVSLTNAAIADDGIRLSRLAAASGYTYAWSASDAAVTLQRPGVVILLHAGYPQYEVNAMPAAADRAPRIENGDLIVSQALADRLRQIAVGHPLADPPAPSNAAAGVARAPSAPQTDVLTIKARQIPGREALTVTGTAPANAAVVITLTGKPSRELPEIVLSRTTVMTGDDGRFSAVASITQDFHLRTPIAVTAASLAGGPPAATTILIDVPSPDVDSIFDQFPPK